MVLQNILVITSNNEDARKLKNVFAEASDGPFAVEQVTRLADAIDALRRRTISAVLVDLSLPDSQGISTFDKLFAASPATPILTLCNLDNDTLATEAVRRGAQGFLSRGYFESALVPQALRNIIHRKAVEQAFYAEKLRAEVTLNAISDAVISTDASGKLNFLNPASEALTGWSRLEAHGRPITEVFQIINKTTRAPAPCPVSIILHGGEPLGLNADTILIRRDGEEIAIEDSAAPIFDSLGHLIGAVLVFHDISAAQAMRLRMAYLAQHDYLTNLPNRVLLNDRIAQAISLANRQKTRLAILFLDLDNFKHINDSLGHAIGDKLLQLVSHRLCTCVRSSDTVSRQGGDEFVILVVEDRYAEDAALIAEKVLLAFSMPFRVDQHELHISTSIGISVYPIDGDNADALITSADTAMYHAKENGRDNYQFFRHEMNARAIERQIIETGLRHALHGQEFELLFEPKVDLKTGKIIGAEALLRWNHPQWGIVVPERFIAIAEECGLIVSIGHWVAHEACREACRWRDAGFGHVSMSINVSAFEFRRNNFFEGIRDAINTSGIDASCLQLEITESILMRNVDSSSRVLHDLKQLGITIAVDDFGTGYSSLSYLKEFPIDILKIDKSFVRNISTPTNGEGVIVSAIINLGINLQKKVVAEGIETPGQLAFLKERQCAEGQGYLFSRPVGAKHFYTLLSHGLDKDVKSLF